MSKASWGVWIIALFCLGLHAQDGEKRIAPITVTQRVALVVGNAHYTYQDSIPQALHDAQDVAAELRQLGFQVTVVADARVDDLDARLEEFYNAIQRGGGLAVFYYSGHGGSVGEENYLLPVEFQQQSTEEGVSRHAVRMSDVRNRMETSGAAVRLLIFDACRSASLLAAKGSATGLVEMEGKPDGTLIAYASAHGQVSRYDPAAPNSYYTAELLKNLRNGNTDVETLLRNTADAVYATTGRRQMPYVYGHLFEGKLYVRNAPEPSPRAPEQPAGRVDAVSEAWSLTRNSTNPDDFDRFADTIGRQSDLAQVARMRAQQLREAAIAQMSSGQIADMHAMAKSAYESKDFETAMRLYLQLGTRALPEEMRNVGWLYDKDSKSGLDYDDKRALSWYRKAVEAGNARAMNDLGVLSEEGRGVEKDDKQAVAWYRKAADGGYALAMTNLGVMYQRGAGVDKDGRQAAIWYRKAADAGDAEGMDSLGTMLHYGRDIEKDDKQALAWFRKAADTGDAEGMNNLGTMYRAGAGIAKDDSQAVAWFRKGADAGSDNAMYNLAIAYQNGAGVARDEQQAVAWYRKAAETGDSMAMNNLGVLYLSGTDEDDPKAVALFRKSAEAGNPLGMQNLAYMYREGKGLDKDSQQAEAWYAKAAARLREAAEAGDQPAMLSLSDLYRQGLGVKQDETQAAEWTRKAAEAGDPEAMYELGRIYALGNAGIKADGPQALEWYRKAADGGNPNAMASLGDMYQTGLLVRKDLKQAVIWFRKAAELGNSYSMDNLGDMYQEGEGVGKDEAQAMNWYRQAADLGNSFGMVHVGDMYRHGDGVSKDEAQALYWYRKAADMGDSFGMVDLGAMYEFGDGVPKDLTQAIAWYQKSADLGNKLAKDFLTRLGK